MSKAPPFSIIICLYKVTPRFFNDLKHFSLLSEDNFEIIFATEKHTDIDKVNDILPNIPVRIVRSPKEKISLGEKRDLAADAAQGKYCAYIDDDAYPDKNWLINALKDFEKDEKIGAVGGPNLTPPEDGYWEKIGGYIYESYLTSAGAQYRFLPKKRKFVAELQGVNLIIRKDMLKKVGGFNSKLNSGDDSKVCSSLRSAGYNVLYDPEVVVFHHRRKFPIDHLKQIRNMGTHRGFFVKAFPDTLAPIYFFPVILLLGALALVTMSFFSQSARVLLFVSALVSILICYVSSLKRSGIFSSIIVAFGIMLTHITYGLFFIKGLFLVSSLEK